jgi:acetyl esterase/lipase
MLTTTSSRRPSAGGALWALFISLAIVLVPLSAVARADEIPPASNQNADELARAVADRFARAVDHADVAAAERECSLPWLNAFGETVQDAAGLKRGLELYTDFARRFPESGVYYRGIVACLPLEQFRQMLEPAATGHADAQRESLHKLNGLGLLASDRVVLVTWMNAYSILVRFRHGTATVAGLGPVLPAGANLNKVASDQRTYRSVRNVIYGRKNGTALTLDVFTPLHGANGAAVLNILSGDFVSEPMPETDEWILLPLLSRGYTVINIVHGGTPKYNMAEIVRDLDRAARFTRFHAHDYGFDPNRIGVTGSSSGGYLALMLATAGSSEPPLADGIDPTCHPDAIDAVSCRVQAAGCFFPPSDWLNYGEGNKSILDTQWGPKFQCLFDFRDFEPVRHAWVPMDATRTVKLLSDLSPARRVTKDAAATLIFHGEKDPSVPLQQSQLMVARLKAASVPAELVVKAGAGHGWEGKSRDLDRIADWFDRYLTHRP